MHLTSLTIKTLVAFCAVIILGLSPGAQAGTPNSGFAETTLVTSSSLSLVTHMQWAPDGSNRLFVARKGGEIRIVKNGSLLTTPFATVSVVTNGECGLDGLVLDPDFAKNGYVYAFAVVSGPKIQIIRWTASGDIGGSKTILVDNIQSAGRFHNGGGMGFGADGKLYYAVGEIESNVGGDADLTKLNAKINRINPGGGPALSDNPFNDGSGPNNDHIWARGFRNPFGMTIRPGGQVWGLIVGNSWEQIFLVPRGGHCGWNDYEGDQPSGFVVPKLKYSSHGTNFLGGVGALADGCFYNSTQFPSSHRGNLFFCDYTSSAVCRTVPSGDTLGSASKFVSSATSVVDAEVGPDGGLYYAMHSAGSIRRIKHTSTTQDIVVWPTWVNMREDGDHAVMVSLKAAPSANVVVSLARTAGDSNVTIASGASLTFTTSNWSTPQKCMLHAASDTDSTNDSATITATSSGLSSQTIAVNVADTGGSLVVSKSTVSIGEGTSTTYTVKLSAQPSSTVTVTNSRTAGDSSVSVTGGGSMSFTTSNWNTAQTATITAAEDANNSSDTATVSAKATGYNTVNISVTAVDNDSAAPIITSNPPNQNDLTVDELYTYDVNATGLPAPTYSLDLAPAGMTIDPISGVISWTPDSSQIGTFNVIVRAANGVNPDAIQDIDPDLVVGADDAPAASLTRPTEGEIVSGAGAEFYGDGIDDVSTLKAEFFVDGVLKYTDNEATGVNHFHMNGQHNAWDTTTLTDGPHTVSYQVTDTIGQVSTMVTRNVTVSNAVSDAKFSIPAASVTASGSHSSSYLPANTVDGSLSTRWTMAGDGQWIQYDLGATKTVAFVKLAFYAGDTRSYFFDVQVASSAAGPFTTVLPSQTSGATLALQTFNFTDVSARYVRILCHMGDHDTYNNITETEVWGH